MLKAYQCKQNRRYNKIIPKYRMRKLEGPMKKLKKWQIVLIVILALGVIGVLAGGGDE